MLDEAPACSACGATWESGAELAGEYAEVFLGRNWYTSVTDGGEPPTGECPDCGEDAVVAVRSEDVTSLWHMLCLARGELLATDAPAVARRSRSARGRPPGVLRLLGGHPAERPTEQQADTAGPTDLPPAPFVPRLAMPARCSAAALPGRGAVPVAWSTSSGSAAASTPAMTRTSTRPTPAGSQEGCRGPSAVSGPWLRRRWRRCGGCHRSPAGAARMKRPSRIVRSTSIVRYSGGTHQSDGSLAPGDTVLTTPSRPRTRKTRRPQSATNNQLHGTEYRLRPARGTRSSLELLEVTGAAVAVAGDGGCCAGCCGGCRVGIGRGERGDR